ncbi:MAG: hypothetical protein ACE5JU_09725 [Candidatus Binatia bacterium]
MRIALGWPSRVVPATGDLILEWATRADRGPFFSKSKVSEAPAMRPHFGRLTAFRRIMAFPGIVGLQGSSLLPSG